MAWRSRPINNNTNAHLHLIGTCPDRIDPLKAKAEGRLATEMPEMVF